VGLCEVTLCCALLLLISPTHNMTTVASALVHKSMDSRNTIALTTGEWVIVRQIRQWDSEESLWACALLSALCTGSLRDLTRCSLSITAEPPSEMIHFWHSGTLHSSGEHSAFARMISFGTEGIQHCCDVTLRLPCESMVKSYLHLFSFTLHSG
jgi:hypothetical protein